MAKKTFTGGLSSLLGEKPQKNEELAEMPVSRSEKNTSKAGLRVGETRATFIISEESLKKLRAVSYWDRMPIKDVMQAAIDQYLDRYEAASGKPIAPAPQKQ